MKSASIRSLRVLTLLAMCCSVAATAHAAPSEVPTTTRVDIGAACQEMFLCNLDVGSDLLTYFGAGEGGHAIFDLPAVQGWTFDFVSSAPLSWNFQMGQGTQTYEAVFGQGDFEMTDNGMTFTGMMTSGSSSEFCNGGGCDVSVDAFFFGQWSNGMYASGEAGLSGLLTDKAYVTASLETAIVPEPNSLALLSSGIIGLAGVVRRSLTSGSR